MSVRTVTSPSSTRGLDWPGGDRIGRSLLLIRGIETASVHGTITCRVNHSGQHLVAAKNLPQAKLATNKALPSGAASARAKTPLSQLLTRRLCHGQAL